MSTDKTTNKEENYRLLLKQIDLLVNPDEPLVTGFANITGALKETFDKISWVGFYFTRDNNLFLGPFQGKVACTKIKIGEGVCGTCAKSLKSQVVPNVHEYPGHIACDVESNSEIVVPLIYGNNVYGVLDLDSKEFSAFDETDKKWLEKLTEMISEKFDLSKTITN